MHLQAYDTTSVKQQLVLIETDNHNTIHLKVISQSLVPTDVFNKKVSQIQQKQLEHSSRAIWIHLNQFNLCYIQPLLQKDYFIHRGYKKDVSLYKWTAQHKDCIPQFSRVFIGCGAMIIKDSHVFLVQQKSGDRKGLFGLPGGRADPGEFISQATQRQLFEETGIKSKFEYIIYFRQFPKSLWGSSDIYFVSIVSVDEKQFENVKLCKNQISCFEWVHLSQYEEFMQINGSPTQKNVAKYITQLYNKGYDFRNKSNLTVQKEYKPNSDIILVQHLVTGIELLQQQK